MVSAKNEEGSGTWSESGVGKTEAKAEVDWIDLTASFAYPSYTVTEGGSRTITVSLSPGADRRQAIPITVTAGSAESGDYEVTGLTNGELPFVPGNESVTFTFRANHDNDKSNERVTLAFGDPLPNNIKEGTTASVTVTIRDDDRDPPPTPRPVPEPAPTPTVPSIPSPPYTGGGGGGGWFGGFGGGGSSGSGGDADTGTDTGDGSRDPNRPPYFNEGVATGRSVLEHTSRAVYIGEAVTATDPDDDVLTYALGGKDADSFALDSQTGQLISSTTLDFELKLSFEIVMTVTDGRGAGDAIEITVKVIDLTEVPIYGPQTQAAALVKPGEATTIETPDGTASVTFPVQSRNGYYWARLDSAWTRCGFDPGDEELQASLVVDFLTSGGLLSTKSF